MKKRFTDDQIIGAVKKLEAGTAAKELAREMGATQQTLYRWGTGLFRGANSLCNMEWI